ncbi:MAG: class I SAM-dependent methyltransferase [bacterium]|nr:class I SAM-dependent methyltransferase [bacterium]
MTHKLSHNEQSKLFWDNNGYTWNIRVSPVNPSEDDLNIYKKYLIDGKKNKKVLLLGSTPLLRSLLSEVGFKNYVVADFSFAVIETSLRALNKLGINLSTENEIWLKSDWLDMPLELESFDCIVGDMVFTQIEPHKQPLFVEKLASLLKPKGYFIGRVHICNLNVNDREPRKIIEEILSSKDLENTVEQRFALLYKLRDRLRNNKTQTTSPHTIISELLKYQTSDEKKRDFLRSVVNMISRRAEIGLPFISQTKDEFMNVIFKEFSLETIVTASDYTSEYFPIYVLQKKT